MGISNSLPLKGLEGKNPTPFKEECQKGEVVSVKHSLPLGKTCLSNGRISAKRMPILKNSVLPFGKISAGQMGRILTKPQQTLNKILISKI